MAAVLVGVRTGLLFKLSDHVVPASKQARCRLLLQLLDVRDEVTILGFVGVKHVSAAGPNHEGRAQLQYANAVTARVSIQPLRNLGNQPSRLYQFIGAWQRCNASGID